jgi:uncharacterized protein YqeY
MLYDTIQKDLLQNMKSGNKFDLNVLRMLKSALQMEKINKQNDLSDNEIVNVIKKQVKQRKDSILEFAKYNREDEVANLNKEIELLQKYLPQELSLTEINNGLDEIFIEIKPEGMKDMRNLMTAAQNKFGAQADMSLVSKLIRERLNN